MAVPISAEVETGYNFTVWNGYKDTAISTLTTTFQMPAESVTLKANAVMPTTNNGEAGSIGAYETRHSDVKTGDLSTPIIWMLLLLGSALVGSAVLILKRKRK
ncbi:InlB B-repeat-containing protein [Ohessyouella blattaphilus]|uniref:InlB B-repeat-containing protein n=1 Tax=Ohessyouella blattaphilus TaxID=2949333 RepID=UPI003EBCDC73